MPYRNQATVGSWLDEFFAANPDVARATEISVLEQDVAFGADSALVVVALRTATTVTYIQPLLRDDKPVWTVTFEPRADELNLDAAATAKLSADLGLLALLCAFLQNKTESVTAPVA